MVSAVQAQFRWVFARWLFVHCGRAPPSRTFLAHNLFLFGWRLKYRIGCTLAFRTILSPEPSTWAMMTHRLRWRWLHGVPPSQSSASLRAADHQPDQICRETAFGVPFVWKLGGSWRALSRLPFPGQIPTRGAAMTYPTVISVLLAVGQYPHYLELSPQGWTRPRRVKTGRQSRSTRQFSKRATQRLWNKPRPVPFANTPLEAVAWRRGLTKSLWLTCGKRCLPGPENSSIVIFLTTSLAKFVCKRFCPVQSNSRLGDTLRYPS